MAVLTEGKHTAEYMLSEANGSRSRSTGTLILGQNLESGTVLGTITASGKLTQYDPVAVDGSESVSAILYDNIDATDADVVGVTISVRDNEVRGSSLTYSVGADATAIATADAELVALGMIVR